MAQWYIVVAQIGRPIWSPKLVSEYLKAEAQAYHLPGLRRRRPEPKLIARRPNWSPKLVAKIGRPGGTVPVPPGLNRDVQIGRPNWSRGTNWSPKSVAQIRPYSY